MDIRRLADRRRTWGKSRATVTAVTAALLLGAAVLAQTAAAVNGGTLYVAKSGTDTAACRLADHPCLTIGYALSQATTNSTIEVAGGTYQEQLVIPGTMDVSIVGGWPPPGSSSTPTVIDPTSVPTSDTDPVASHSPPYSIIDAQPGSTVNLSNLTVLGSGAESTFTDCSKNFIGVYYHDASGAMSHVTVDDIELPTAEFGCQDGLAVYVASDPSSTSNVSMNWTLIDNYDKNGITCRAPGTTCSISFSTVRGIGATPLTAQNGIEAFDVGSADISDNHVTDNSYTDPDYCPSMSATCVLEQSMNGNDGTAYSASTGILVIDNQHTSVARNQASGNDVDIYLQQDGTDSPYSPWTLQNNSATGAVNNSGTQCNSLCEPVPFGNGVGDGIVLDGVTNLTATGNYATGNVEYGIALYDATSATTLSNNTATTSGDGIYLGDTSTNNTLQSNNVSNNSIDGILADTNSSMNTFQSNTMNYNSNFGAHDLSTGTGTSGTANTWTSNSCQPPFDSHPAGLCS